MSEQDRGLDMREVREAHRLIDEYEAGRRTYNELEALADREDVKAFSATIEQVVIDSGVGWDEIHPTEIAARLTAAGYALAPRDWLDNGCAVDMPTPVPTPPDAGRTTTPQEAP